MNTLDRLEELERKATPGPFERFDFTINPSKRGKANKIKPHTVPMVRTIWIHGQAKRQIYLPRDMSGLGNYVVEQWPEFEPADADLIVAMRNALPKLLHALRLAVAQEATKTATEYLAINKEFRAALAELTADSEP